MTATDIIILHFEEIRRRSVKLWSGLTPEQYSWQPDPHAMTAIEMIRHVLEGEHLFHKIIDNRGNLGSYVSPWQGRPYLNLHDELAFAKPYRERFLNTVKAFGSEDLAKIEIVRSEKGQRRQLGDYLLRIGYHESVHTGQMLSYFRTLGIERPVIWD